MNVILFKHSRFKKYGTVALLKIESENRFVVAFHYLQTENSQGFGNTPKENVFPYDDEPGELQALKQAIEKYESIRA